MKNSSEINIVFFGTPEFAIPSLSTLLGHAYHIRAVVTNPDEPVGRKQILTPPPAKVWAQKHGIPVFQPIKLDISYGALEIPEADLYIVVAYGKIIPRSIIELPKFGSLNVHPSLLPRWRGPSPIQYTILSGDTVTGVTIIKIDELMDHGPAIAATNFQLPASSRPTYQELHNRLAEMGAKLLIQTLPKWIHREITQIPQDDTKATYSKILKKEDGRINWSKPAEEIERMVRAFNPWPGAWTLWPMYDKIYRLRIEEAAVTEEEPPHGSYGYIWSKNHTFTMVKTGKGSLLITRITLEGKKSMSTAAFIAGHPTFIGATLI